MARFLDERGRIFGKVNVVDILVLLVIIAVVVFAVVRFTGTSSASVPLTVTYTVESVRQLTVDAIQKTVEAGGTVRDDGGTVLGKVEDIEVTPTKAEYMTPEGQLEAFDSPIFSDVQIIVQGEGSKSGETLRIGSVPMLVGRKVTLRGSDFEVQSVIWNVISGEEALK
jgi:hypothetical protein